ncbi:hypothetical protein [Bradyrhizobium sp. BR 1432]|uniref:hypothetical protein n=1 Tax=Bradyrhizobium sp. BR 1432 TaxID=3447966 RepID=UPI003EE4FF2B
MCAVNETKLSGFSSTKVLERTNLWAFFQAESIRCEVVQTSAEHGNLTLRADQLASINDSGGDDF